MLNQMQSRFQTMSDNIVNRIDEMGSRIDELEKNIADLVQEAQSEVDQQKAPGAQQQRPQQLWLILMQLKSVCVCVAAALWIINCLINN